MMDHGISTNSLLMLASIFHFITSAYCDCVSPPSISHGLLKEEFTNQKTFQTGDTVQYSCQPGFMRILGTKNTVTCMGNSRWTRHEKFCTEKSCGNPGDIENGYFEASNFLFGAEVTYYCNEGYRMISSRVHRFCQADGTWSNSVPECEVVICPYPDSIPSGTFYPQKDEYNFMDTINYQCNSPKFALYGKNFASCTENGTWSSNPPKCIEVDCPPPEVPSARKVTGFVGPYSINSLVRFECLEGFTMNGTSDVKCNIHSQWEPSLPTCNRNFCYMPHLINGKISGGTPKSFNNEEGFHIEDSVTMSCDSFFVLNGESTITCQEDLNWNPEVPICEKRFGCSSPKILNGRAVLKNGEYYFPEKDGHAFSKSDTIHVQCNEGFTITESSVSKCELTWSGFKWLPSLPKCTRW
ncbi:complement receptor type 1-like [Hyla sarda]|uniref:complement receptor type 1-like n=1 Tax=Hyla sarda TaxID=327740 RepID=UPI0024C39822|nr:complement receptor type 1-like [Hyla sarda]